MANFGQLRGYRLLFGPRQVVKQRDVRGQIVDFGREVLAAQLVEIRLRIGVERQGQNERSGFGKGHGRRITLTKSNC